MSRTVNSFCRACHACCGVLVDIEKGVPIRVRGDKENPLFQGFCCIKGQNYAAQRNSPNRLWYSQKRQPDGSYLPIPVDQAIDEIAVKLTSLIKEHGARSVAAYIGTFGSTSSSANSVMSGAWMTAIGSPMTFTSNTIDQPGKFVAAALFGRWMAPSHNFLQAQATLLIGMNPLVSMSGGIPHTNPGRHLTDALKRGMKLIVIDPRRSETARRAQIHLQPKPGADIPILAAMLQFIIDNELYDAEFVADNTTGLSSLRAALEVYTPEVVTELSGLDYEQITEAAREFATAGSGVATAGTGPNMSGNTTLLEYLVLCLNTLCGRWLRAGEQVTEPATLSEFVQPIAQAQSPSPEFAYGFGEQLRVRNLSSTAAGLPTAALPDEILLPGEGQVKALISHGGNPVSIWPDQVKAIESIRALELSVQIDLTMSTTARESDYVIAVRHPLEMPGITLTHEFMNSYAPGFGTTAPWAQYSPAVVEPPEDSDLLEDWQFFYRLAQRMELQLEATPILWHGTSGIEPWTVDMTHEPTTDDIFEFVTKAGRVSLEEVKQYPAGAIFADPAVIVAPKEANWEGRLDLANNEMMSNLMRSVHSGETKGAYPFRLVSRRQINVLNSSWHDNPGQVRGDSHNPAFMHPLDMEALELNNGMGISLSSEHGTISAVVKADKNLRRGVISMSHGWGGLPEQDQAFRDIGSNTGKLISNDSHYERYTGLPRMSNIPVAVKLLNESSSSPPNSL
ncbi:molybdopterin-dependent oxidoreductase [Parahaliea sp. F7430]|uniref:Molybdopterin-dependent oxidoreductase n=1 Tax=Sediminihaliea albiluteola TaxID=2758564 RepID=A0A7W2TW85_9GAMM|nr:molybdopterin-dependent oxidoreductase [Sediminihaliea albiluteola]MBA6413068.1 molybdopterin-dependent oxidoreductase [Sediminihaliea albiluteola]